jgi:transcription initiation protein SPT3
VVARRGARAISPEDLLFLLRHDVNRSARLKEFLSWKDVRKNAKTTTSGEDSGSAATSTGNDAELDANQDDSALVAEIEDDAKSLAAADNNNNSSSGSGSGGYSNNNNNDNNQSNDSSSAQDRQANKNSSSAMQIGPKRRQLGLFWDLGHALFADLASTYNDGTSLTSFDSRDAATSQRETLRRLRHADLLTLSMSQTEYMEYSECRQASFTYKKARKFREWLVGGTGRPGSLAFATLAGGSARDLARLNDDTLEILGFLAYEIVQKLTEVSLAVKYESELKGSNSSPLTSNSTSTTNNNMFKTTTQTQTQAQAPPPPKTPILVQHVEEAYRKLMSVNIDSINLFHHGVNKRRKFIL